MTSGHPAPGRDVAAPAANAGGEQGLPPLGAPTTQPASRLLHAPVEVANYQRREADLAATVTQIRHPGGRAAS